MKKLLTLSLVILMAFSINAQDNAKPFYLLFEFMHVKPDKGNDYLQVEDFWSGIHKQRVADKSIVGWDLWSLIPSGVEQGSQYLTVTVFASLKDMLQAVESLDVMAYSKKAYPNKSEAELTELFNKTGASRDLAHQVMLKIAVHTKDNFKMKVGTMATMDIMKELDDSYEKVAQEVFLPRQQGWVEAAKKGSWELDHAILPAGSESYGTQISISMYNDISQMATFLEDPKTDMDMTTKLAINEGMKTRQWKEMKIAKLLKIVR